MALKVSSVLGMKFNLEDLETIYPPELKEAANLTAEILKLKDKGLLSVFSERNAKPDFTAG